MPKYCYVVSYHAEPDTPASEFTLRQKKRLPAHVTAWRVPIPNDMVLTDCEMPSAFRTKDTRTLRQLGASPIVRLGGRWQVVPYLAELPIKEWHRTLCGHGWALDLNNTTYIRKDRPA